MYDVERLRRMVANCAAEIERERVRRRRGRKALYAVLGVVGVLVMLALGAMMAMMQRSCTGYDEVELERARAEGSALAEAKAAACGGWDGFGGYTHRMVNQWCHENGRDDAYPDVRKPRQRQ